MQQTNRRLMGRLIHDSRWHLLAALVCTVLTVMIELVTPLILAETMDCYLQGKPSRMPAFLNQWVEGLGGPGFMARHLWIAGLALVLLNVISGVFSYWKGRAQAVAGENAALTLRDRLYSHL